MSEVASLPPRVLIVMPDQWTRALLRAALREVGYDAVGTRNLQSATRIPVGEAERSLVKLVVVDQDAVNDVNVVNELLKRHGAPSILIARRTSATPAGPWQRVIYRPISVDDIVRVVEDTLPLDANRQHPLD